MQTPNVHSHGHSFKLRIIAGLLMLALGFIGVIVTDISKNGAWYYWRWTCVIYALLSLGMSWHLKARGLKMTISTVWHEIAHWAGLIGTIWIVSFLVGIGLIGRFEASVLTLLLLAFATFLAGIYIEPTLILIGCVLGGFAIGIGFINTYLYTILVPLTVVGGIALWAYVHYAHKKQIKL